MAQQATAPRYLVNDHSYDWATDTLTLEVDCPERDRCYRVTWQAEEVAPLRVLAHWGADCVESIAELHRDEARELERWLDASDQAVELRQSYRRDELEAMAS